VEELSKWAQKSTSYDVKFVVYALGLTQNPRATRIVLTLARDMDISGASVLASALEALGYHGDAHVGKQAVDTEGQRRPQLALEEVFQRYCPDLPDRSTADLMFGMYIIHGLDVVKAMQVAWPSDLSRLMRVVPQLREQRKFWEEEILVAEALERYPMIDHLYHDFALALAHQGRPVAASRYFSVAQALHPTYADFYNDYAIRMMEIGDLSAARFLLVRAIALDPTSYRPWLNLGNLNLAPGPTAGSVSVREGIRGNERIQFVGEANLDVANLFDARICFAHALRLAPAHKGAREALEMVCSLTEASADYAPTNQELASALHLGELEPQEVIHRKWDDKAVSLFKASTGERARGNLESALQLIVRAEDTEPTALEIVEARAMLLDNLDKLEDAKEAFERALRIQPTSRTVLISYSGVLLRLGLHNEAIRTAQRAIGADPYKVTAWIVLARCYLAVGNRAEARDTLSHALTLCAPYSWALLHIEELCSELGVDGRLPW
jgi:tetratricopeptide (TPR) repeat protein